MRLIYMHHNYIDNPSVTEVAWDEEKVQSLAEEHFANAIYFFVDMTTDIWPEPRSYVYDRDDEVRPINPDLSEEDIAELALVYQNAIYFMHDGHPKEVLG